VPIADRVVMMPDVESVQLKDQHAIRDQTLVLSPAVRTLTAEGALVPAAARFDIGDRDERLWPRVSLVGQPSAALGQRAKQ
jgi:hypothetical protein